MREHSELATAAAAVNDELTIIVSCVERALAGLDAVDPARVWLASISAAAQRCARNTVQLVRAVGEMDKTRSAVIQMPAVEFDRPFLDRLLRDAFGEKGPQL